MEAIMREPRSYVVRIYWHDSRDVCGTIEDARTNGKRPFRSADELLQLLRRPIREIRRTERNRRLQSSEPRVDDS